MDVSENVIVVTGASRGIGAALCNYYLAKGNRVSGLSRANVDHESPLYRHWCTDVCDDAAVKETFYQIRKETRIDVLINNAGVASMNHVLLTPTDSIQKIMATNFTGAVICSRECGKVMRAQGEGRIINLSSVAVPLRIAGESIYAASKAALESFTRTASKEFSDFGITINALGLTPIQTDMIAGVSEEKLNAILDQQALSRFATIDDVTNAIDFFVRPESAFVTGQVLYLGGVS